MINIRFINELKNKIQIKIKNQKDTNKNYKTKEEYTFIGVNIKIIGPTSMSENTLTRKEAVELYNALGKFLKNE